MNSVTRWLYERWPDIVFPLAIFFIALIATFWLRSKGKEAFDRWVQKSRQREKEILFLVTRRASVLWCLIISIYLALLVSAAPQEWKSPVGKGLWSFFLVSLTLSAFQLMEKLVPLYGEKLKAPQRFIKIAMRTFWITILILAVLMLLDIWGVPTSPFLLLIGVAILAAALLARNTIPNLTAWLQIAATGEVKVGDYIKLETGEEGYVKNINWGSVKISALDETLITVPNRKLVESTLINYGRPIKKAKEPFRFYARAHLKELTGLKARDLKELVDILKKAPDSIVYYHTHHFLEEHHYLTPEPANDFAIWISDVLGDEVLGEQLASVDTFAFASLGALRERLVNIMEEKLAREENLREASEGREFYFMKSVSFILPTPYVVHDLREFIEALRKLSLGSLYFHIFESRLRLGRGLNDFSIWLQGSLEEGELAEKVAHLDPYTYTLEGLRSTLIQLIEKRVK